MARFKRIILLVLDGVGVGALPDAAAYQDSAAATLPHVAAAVGGLSLPCLQRLGLGNIATIPGLSPTARPQAAWGKMAEQSAGKDSVTGHWELSGLILNQPFAVFPDGFPDEIIAAFRQRTGLDPLGNIAASGTEILKQLGEQHLRSGRPIVYTSSDSVFQIAAHEEVIPVRQLYRICRQAAEILKPYNVCRVIARPFVGDRAENFQRTSGRHDFLRRPPAPTCLKRLQMQGIRTRGIGKIGDLFAGDGLSESLPTANNREGMERTRQALGEVERGLIMTNLIDFDMLYGHRQDSHGFAAALREFDRWLDDFCPLLSRDDLLIVTADHGCDPTTPGTDHTREYVPLLAIAQRPDCSVNLGVRATFADVGQTVADNFEVALEKGRSFLDQVGS